MPVVSKVSDSHTLSEFIAIGNSIPDKFDHRSFCMIENRDDIEYYIHNVIDDYLPELKQQALVINFSPTERDKYMFNPKLLCYKIYNTTLWYYIILRLNNMCNTHEFSISNNKLLLIPVNKMKDSLSKIFNSNSTMIKRFNNKHANDTTPVSTIIKR